MNRYQFELATEADDADLRHVLAATPMAGDIALSFRREPNYFAASTVEGASRQVVVARDTQTGSIVGFGSRAVSERYVNGARQSVGYLSSLRLLAEHRNRGLVARGYAFFRDLHGDGLAPFYLTTIAQGNELAQRLLTSGRAGLPRYEPRGEYVTAAIPLTYWRARVQSSGVEIVTANAGALPELLAFLHEQGPHRQFFPCYQAVDLSANAQLLRGLSWENIWLAYWRGKLAGVLAAWDQGSYKQTVVDGYSSRLTVARPLYNAWAHVARWPKLPAPGMVLKYMTLALPVVADDDPAVLAALIHAIGSRYWGGPYQHLMLGLHRDDPLLAALSRWPHTPYCTQLYCVYWADGESAVRQLDGRVPYLELGCL